MLGVVKLSSISVFFISVCTFSSLANDTLDVSSELYPVEPGCRSIVCNKINEPQSVNKASDFPERVGNETLSLIGGILFTLGEMGLAENLLEEELSGSAKK
ncbi:hypothetical protein ACYTR9_03070 [Vibrio antiquarius]|uniref:hypothetical protein n=1 Tax=Vibrio diabolicus TaxID=50719 RepID=UPI002ED7760A